MFFHKHRRLIMVFIFIFVGLPLTLMIPGVGSIFGGPSQVTENFPVAKVGSTPITAATFINAYNRESEQRSLNGLPTTASSMVNDGTVDQILDFLIREALIANEAQNDPVFPEEDYLIERLRDDPYFQNESGQFNKGLYNQWVQTNSRQGISWTGLYDNMAAEVNKKVYLDLVGASARVLDSEIRREFERTHTKLRIRVVKVEPKVELSEEEFLAHYESNLKDFMTFEQRWTEFVAISLEAPRPAIIDELVERARAGEDFAALAKEHSESLDKEEGGDMGWIGESRPLPPYQQFILDLAVGQVSDPVESLTGIQIFKAEEERTNDAGEREVHVRQITIRPELDLAERQAREEQAGAILTAASGTEGSLQAAAEAAGVSLNISGTFDLMSSEIEGVPDTDVFVFRRGAGDLGIYDISEIIQGRDNLYIATVVEIIAPALKSFDEVRGEVEMAAIGLYKNGPEYISQINNYVTQIRDNEYTLDQIVELIPELEAEIIETETFGLNDFLFNQGLLLDTRQVFGLLVDKEPGEIAGPIRDFGRSLNYLEIAEKTLPDQTVWDDQWEVEGPELRKALLASRRAGRQSDYLRHLTEKASSEAMIQKDYEAVFLLLGLDETGSEPEPERLPVAPAFEELLEDTDEEAPVTLELEDDQE